MSQINVDIKGIEDLKRTLKQAPALAVGEFGKAVQKSALTLQSAAIKEAPVNKGHGGGNLRQNIRVQSLTKTRAVIRSAAPYSAAVEEGTRPHVIVPRVKKALADRRNNLFFGRLVHHPGTKANPFMQRAVEKTKSQVSGFFEVAIKTILKKSL